MIDDYTVATEKSFKEAVNSVLKAIKKRGLRVLHIHDISGLLASAGFSIEPLSIVEFCSERKSKASYKNIFIYSNIMTIESAVKNRNRKQYLTWWILPLVVIGGWFYPLLGYLLPICMMAAMGIALFKGRYWCDWMCPRGTSWDLLLRKISLKKEVPLFFRSTPFRMLWIMILMGVLAWKLPTALASLNPINQVGLVFTMLLTVTTLVGIVLGIPIHHRIWCGFCPVGTMSNWIGKGKYALEINSSCKECKTCHEVCPMQVRKWEDKQEKGWTVVENWDCLKCGLCIEVCPEKALKFKEAS